MRKRLSLVAAVSLVALGAGMPLAFAQAPTTAAATPASEPVTTPASNPALVPGTWSFSVALPSGVNAPSNQPFGVYPASIGAWYMVNDAINAGLFAALNIDRSTAFTQWYLELAPTAKRYFSKGKTIAPFAMGQLRFGVGEYGAGAAAAAAAAAAAQNLLGAALAGAGGGGGVGVDLYLKGAVGAEVFVHERVSLGAFLAVDLGIVRDLNVGGASPSSGVGSGTDPISLITSSSGLIGTLYL